MSSIYGFQSPGHYGYAQIQAELEKEQQNNANNEFNDLLNGQSSSPGDSDYWQGYNESLETEYDKMGELASQQSQEWLQTQSQLMGESSAYRSKESAQQYEQDRQLQRDTINSNERMQQEEFGHNMDVIAENEAIDQRTRSWQSNNAMNAYKNL